MHPRPNASPLAARISSDLLRRVAESFAANGVVFVRGVLPTEAVEGARRATEDAIAARGGFVEGGSLTGDTGFRRVDCRGCGPRGHSSIYSLVRATCENMQSGINWLN